ncbi:MAG: hypothetical protein ACO25B_00675 [Chitinophagaceae bacterium]
MKKSLIIHLTSRFRVFLLPLCWLFLLAVPATLSAQDDSTAKTEEPAVEEAELISPSVTFTGVQKSDNTIDLKVALKAKVNGQFIKLYKLKVRFAEVVNEEDRDLGFVITDGNGKATLNIKTDSLKPDAEGKLNFKVIFAGNKAMEPAEETLSFKRARLEITPEKEDSVMTVKVKLMALGSGEGSPVSEATVGIFVKRSFLPLKVGEVTTDESGEASFEFPANLPGDAKGNLTLYGRLDESEDYGNLEATAVQTWGKPVSDQLAELPRALWSTHPPIWMLITFIVLMATVWGHYIVIIYELFRLRKEEPHATNA